MAEVVRPGMAAAPLRHPPSAFAEVQQQPDGVDLNLESLLPSDLTFAIEFAQPAKPSKPPAYKPTALPTQLLQPSTSAVIPPNNPWSYDPFETTGRSNSNSQSQQNQNQQQAVPLLGTSRSVPDRAAYSHYNQHGHLHLSSYHNGGASAGNAGNSSSPRPPVSLLPPPPPPPPPRGGATTPAAPPLPPPISPSGPVRISSSSSSSASPRQSPVHSRSGNSDYGSGASPDDYYAIGQPPPPPPRDGTSTVTAPARASDGTISQRGSVVNRSFLRRNSAGSGSNFGGSQPPPPPPPPRDLSAGHAPLCPPLDLGALTTSACDGSVLVTQNSRGGMGAPAGVPSADCWPQQPPPPPSKNSTPRPPAHLQPPPPPPPPPRSDQERLRTRSSSSSAAPFVNSYPPPPPPPPPPRHPASIGQCGDVLHNADATSVSGDTDVTTGFKVPTVQEAQLLVAAALQDDSDSSLAAALELSSKLQSLAAQRIAAAAQPGNSARQTPSTNSSAAMAFASGGSRSPPALGANGRGSFNGQSLQPLPPPAPLPPTDSGRLASIGSGASGLYSRSSATPRSGGCFAPPPPPPPPPRHLSLGSSVSLQAGGCQASSPPSVSLPPPPPPPPPRAPVPQPPSADVAAVMAALPEVRSPFALYQRASDDDDCCSTPPDETMALNQQMQQLSPFATSPPCGFAPGNSSAAAAVAAAAVAAASSAPFSNPYASLFSSHGTASGSPFGVPVNTFAGIGALNGNSVGSGAFGSDVFATPSVASSTATAAAAASVGSQEVSVASLTSLLTTLAALAKQGGSAAAAPTAAVASSVSPDAVSTGIASSTTVSCSDPSGPGTPAAKGVTMTEPSPLSGVRASAGGSIAGSDDIAASSVTPSVMFRHMTSTPPVSPPASTVAPDEGVLEASELLAPAAAVSSDFTISAPVNEVVPSVTSLAALQQALALLAGEVPVAPAAASPPVTTVNAITANRCSSAMTGPAEAGSDLCSAVLSLPGLTVTPQELQMARSLHAALKVVALLDSLSGSAAVGCQSTAFRV